METETPESFTRQKRLVAARERERYYRWWNRLHCEEEGSFVKYLYSLFFRIYELHLDGKYIRRMQAGLYIPLKHPATIKRHIDAAVAAGYLRFETSETDERVTVLKPGPQLIQLVESEIEREMREASEIILGART
jgi:hypothetical protein